MRRGRRAMQAKLFTTITVVLALAASTSAATAAPAPASPGACNMFNVSPTGMDGMAKASAQGLGNMMALVDASITAGCRP